MRGALLGAVAIGAPLILMLVGWHFWNASPSTPSTIRQPAPASSPSSLAGPPRPRSPHSAAGSAEARDLTDWIDEAMELCARRIRKDPDAQLVVAGELLAHGDTARALTAFDRVLVQKPDDPGAMYGKAMALVKSGRSGDAIPLFEHLLEREPDNAPVRFSYAIALTRNGERAAAMREFETIAGRHPDHVGARYNLAILLQAANRRQESIALWRQLTQPRALAPAAAAAPSAAGRPHARPGVVTAMKPPEEHLAVAPAVMSPELLREAWYHRGELALDLHLVDEADACFLNVINARPDDARAWCNVGIARAGAGRRAEAIEALDKALQIEPDLLPAVNQLLFVYAANYRDTEDASMRRKVLDLCDRSLSLQPRQPNIVSLRSTLRSGGNGIQ